MKRNWIIIALLFVARPMMEQNRPPQVVAKGVAVVGKTIIVVANLMPAKIAGFESCGMLLAAKNETSLKLVTVDGGDAEPGLTVG